MTNSICFHSQRMRIEKKSNARKIRILFIWINFWSQKRELSSNYYESIFIWENCLIIRIKHLVVSQPTIFVSETKTSFCCPNQILVVTLLTIYFLTKRWPILLKIPFIPLLTRILFFLKETFNILSPRNIYNLEEEHEKYKVKSYFEKSLTMVSMKHYIVFYF